MRPGHRRVDDIMLCETLASGIEFSVLFLYWPLHIIILDHIMQSQDSPVHFIHVSTIPRLFETFFTAVRDLIPRHFEPPQKGTSFMKVYR